MEKVRTGSLPSRDISPTMIVESMPPERNAARGTSLWSRNWTNEVNSSRSSSAALMSASRSPGGPASRGA